MSIGGLFKLTRFPLVFTAAADSAVGAALVGVSLLHSTTWIPAVVASSLLYAGGMVLNDVADLDRDRRIHPERPLPSGRVDAGTAGLFATVLLFLAVAAATLGGGTAFVWAAGMAAMIAGYDCVFKHISWAGAAAMAAIRGANLGLGAVVAGADPRAAGFPWAPLAILAAFVFVLTLWSTREERPQEGRGLLSLLGAGLVLVPLSGILLTRPVPWAAGAASLWILPWVIRAMFRPERDRIMQAVRWGVLGIIPLDASFLASNGRWPEAVVVAGLLIPALALLPVFRKL
ncbi:MAG TPA: UbiA family prenyltransferase [Planctomycetota bacterium]|nr:UbiA family prenyltransferase [Planctomycetota bacterium]